MNDILEKLYSPQIAIQLFTSTDSKDKGKLNFELDKDMIILHLNNLQPEIDEEEVKRILELEDANILVNIIRNENSLQGEK